MENRELNGTAEEIETMSTSRFKKNTEKKMLRNILLGIGGIGILLILIGMFGPQLLINFSTTVEQSKEQNDTANVNQDSNFIAPPVLNPIETATNSAKITISGSSTLKQTINLYINNKLVDKTSVNKDTSFTFKDILLEQGQNDIKAKAVSDDNKQSDYSK